MIKEFYNASDRDLQSRFVPVSLRYHAPEVMLKLRGPRGPSSWSNKNYSNFNGNLKPVEQFPSIFQIRCDSSAEQIFALQPQCRQQHLRANHCSIPAKITAGRNSPPVHPRTNSKLTPFPLQTANCLIS